MLIYQRLSIIVAAKDKKVDLTIKSDYYPNDDTKLIIRDDGSAADDYVTIELLNDGNWNFIHLNVDQISHLRDFLKLWVQRKDSGK